MHTCTVCVRQEGRDVGEGVARRKVCTQCPQHMYTSGVIVLPQMLLQAVIWPSFYGDTNALGFASLRISANKQRANSVMKANHKWTCIMMHAVEAHSCGNTDTGISLVEQYNQDVSLVSS